MPSAQGARASSIVCSIRGGYKGTALDDAFDAVSVEIENRARFLSQLKGDHQSMMMQDGEALDAFAVVGTRDNESRKVWF